MNEVEFLENESLKLAKSTKSVRLLGSIIVIVLAVYLTWIYKSVKSEILDPDKLSQVGVVYASENLPKLLDTVGNEVLNSAPTIAKSTANKIKNLLPSFRLMMQSEVESSIELIPTLKKEVSDGVLSYLTMHKEDIKSLYDAHKDSDFAEYAVDATLNEITSNLKIDEFNNSSAKIIENLSKQLSELEKKPVSEMTNSEKQKAMILVTIYKHFINKK